MLKRPRRSGRRPGLRAALLPPKASSLLRGSTGGPVCLGWLFGQAEIARNSEVVVAFVNERTKSYAEMTPRRLIRWKSFWLGILVLGFLGWAWLLSLRTVCVVSYTESGDGYFFAMGAENGEIFFSGQPKALYFAADGFQVFSYSGVVKSSLPPAVSLVGEKGEWFIHLAYWFLILLFLIPWSAWLFWHWKREQKKSS